MRKRRIAALSSSRKWCRMHAKRIGNKGFTLIELLVAISVLAIVAVLGWRGLDGIVRARVALTNELEQTRGMQLAFAQMQSDCAHIAQAGDIGGRATLVAEQGRVTMVRTIFADNQPSRVQVVAYRLRDGALTRQESVATRDLTVLDAAWREALDDTSKSQAVLLQSHMSAMMVRSWFSDGLGWRVTPAGTNVPTGGVPGAAAVAPTGLEVALQLQGRSNSMIKVFLLGAI
jgi:general secretion pathway protein J